MIFTFRTNGVDLNGNSEFDCTGAGSEQEAASEFDQLQIDGTADIAGSTLQVTSTATVSYTVSQVNQPPVAGNVWAYPALNTATTIDVLARCSDPDGDTLTITTVGTPADGTVTIPSGGLTVSYTPNTGFVGQDSFDYVVSDGNGHTETATVYVTVANGQWATSVLGESSEWTDTGPYSWYTVQALGTPNTFDYGGDFGDVATAWAAEPENGSSEWISLGFSTPDYASGVLVRETNGNGFVSELELQDTGGTWHTIWSGSDPATAGKPTDFIIGFSQTAYSVQAVRVSVSTSGDDWPEIDAVRLLTGGTNTTTTVAPDQPPTSTDVWASTDEDTAVNVPVLNTAYDPDGDTLTVQSTGTASHGSVSIVSGGGSVTYTPTTGYTGADSFTVTISDGFGGTTTSTVNVTVNDGQWANSVIAASSQTDDGVYNTSVWALGPADTWVYGDTSASWSPNPSSTSTAETLTLGIASADYAIGVLVRESSGNGFVTKIELHDTTGTWHTVWTGTDSTPAGNVQDFVQTFSTTSYQANEIRITVNPTTGDGNPVGIDAVKLLTASAPPSLPTAPSASNDTATTDENMPVNIDVLSNDTNTAGNQLTLQIVSGPSNGTAAVDLHAAPDDYTQAFITYTPNDNYSGSDTFTYVLTDPFGQSSMATVSVTVSAVNQPPVAGSVSAITPVSTSYTFDVLASASDPDGDTLTVTSITQGVNGTTTLNSDGTITYAPTSGFTGPDTFTYIVSDGHGNTSLGIAQIVVQPTGQWASAVVAASSETGSGADALGAPDGAGWTPDGTTALDFLTVGFATSVQATGVRITDLTGGTVSEVDLRDTSGTEYTIWYGTDPATSAGDLMINFPQTSYNVQAVRVFVQSSAGAGDIDAVQLQTTGTYSSVGLSSEGYDDNGNFVTTTYNSAGQALQVKTYTNGQLTQTLDNTYTSGALSATVTTDADSNQTQYTYDANGNTLTETDGYGATGASTTTYTYDTQNRMTSLTDPKGNVTTWSYTGNVTVMTDPFGNTETTTTDDNGNITSVINRNGELTTDLYDDQERLETETEYAGSTTSSSVVDTLNYSYTADGEIESASNSAGTYNFLYDDEDRVIHVDEPTGVSLDFGYDEYGNRNVVKDSLGGEQDSLYNANGQLLSTTLTQGGTALRIDFTYNEFGQVATEKRYSDAAGTTLVATTAYTYDLNGNVTSIVSKDASAATIDEFDYAYDLANEMTAETDYQPLLESTPQTINYSYDAQEEVTGDGTNTYSYDVGGNRNSSGYTYNPNSGATADTNQMSSDGTFNYTYDPEGNETEKVNISTGDYWTYAYNNRNEMVGAYEYTSSNTLLQEVDFVYDAFGNRIEKDVTASGVTTVQKYVLDGWNPAKPTPTGLENFDVIADIDGSGNLTTRYLQGDSVDQLLGRIDKSGSTLSPYWELTDHLGSVRDVVNNSGVTKDSLAYDSFGNIANEYDLAYRGRYAWTGRELDVETQLQYNRARYYDSSNGRWVSQDPLGFDGGDSNLYRYVNNNVTVATDPTGYQVDQVTNSVGISSQGWVIMGREDKKMIIFNLGNRKSINTLPLSLITKRATPPFIAASSNGTDWAFGQQKFIAAFKIDMPTRAAIEYSTFYKGGNVTSVSISPDGKFVAFGADDGVARLLDVGAEKVTEMFGFQIKAATSVSFSADGKYVAAANESGVVKIYDMQARRALLNEISLNQPILSVAYSSNRQNQLLAVLAKDGKVRVYDSDNRLKGQLNAFASKITAIAFSPDGKQIAAAMSNNEIGLWSTSNFRADPQEFDRINLPVSSMMFSADSSSLLVGYKDGSSRLLSVEKRGTDGERILLVPK